MAAQAQKKSSWIPVVLLLLLAFGIFIFALPLLNIGVNTSSQTASEGQCLPNGQGFDDQQEAFTLAQVLEEAF